MPLFDYHCQACGHEFELLVRGDADPICPKCESHELRKKMSLFVVGGSQPTRKAPELPCSSCNQAGSCAFES